VSENGRKTILADFIASLVEKNKAASLNRDFGKSLYRDEKIPGRPSAAERSSPKRTGILSKIDEMREIQRKPEACYSSTEWLFYKQGKLMENVEDDFVFNGVYKRFFPNYAIMNDEQLRGYFSWRTKVRRGELVKTESCFPTLYMYELINQIGTSSSEDAFEKLFFFAKNYDLKDSGAEYYVQDWLADFVAYNNLDKSYVCRLEGYETANAVSVMNNMDKYGDDKLFAAIVLASAYNIERSLFYKKKGDEYRETVCHFFRSYAYHTAKNRKKSLLEVFFGARMKIYHRMFPGAIFYENKPHESCTYTTDAFEYTCKRGEWYFDDYGAGSLKSRKIGDMVKYLDSLMREKYSFKSTINRPELPKYVMKMAEESIDGVMEDRKIREAQTVKIDVSKLDEIRTAAINTRDKLIVEEYEEEIPEEIVGETPVLPADKTAEDENGLSAAEREFLRRLLYGGDPLEPLRSCGIMLSIAVDSVNEKLYDSFGDIVMETDGTSVNLIDDYIEDLKGIIGNEDT